MPRKHVQKNQYSIFHHGSIKQYASRSYWVTYSIMYHDPQKEIAHKNSMRNEASRNTELCTNRLNDLDHQSKKFARKDQNVEVCSSCKFEERRCMGCGKVLKMRKIDELYVNVGDGFTGKVGLVPWGWLETK